ncbi:MAG: HEAT repeat domain-containing protein [bacterium]
MNKKICFFLFILLCNFCYSEKISQKFSLSNFISNVENSDWKIRVTIVSETTNKETMPYLIKIATSDENEWVREAAVESLSKMKNKELFSTFISILEQEKIWFVKKAAIYALQQFEQKKIMPYLKKTLYDENESICKTTIEVLGEIKCDESSCLLLEKLSTLDSTQQNLKGSIILSLSKFKNPTINASLKKILENDPMWFECLLATEQIETLRNTKNMDLLLNNIIEIKQKEKIDIEKKKKTFYELIDDIKNPDEKIKIKAIISLGEFGKEEAILIIQQLLNDPNPWIRKASIISLGKFKNQTFSPILIKYLKDDIWFVRLAVIEIIEKEKYEKAISFLIDLLKKDEIVSVRKACAISLGNFQKDEVVMALINSLRKDSDSEVRSNCALSLGKVGKIEDKKTSSTLLKAYRKEKDSEVKESAAKSLGKLKYEKAIIYLLKDLKNKKTKLNMKIVNIETLGIIGNKIIVPDLINFFKKEPDVLIQSKIIWTLGEIKSEEAIPFLIILLQKQSKENNNMNVDEIAQALIKIGQPIIPYMIKALELENIPKAKEILRKIYQKTMQEKENIKIF